MDKFLTVVFSGVNPKNRKNRKFTTEIIRVISERTTGVILEEFSEKSLIRFFLTLEWILEQFIWRTIEGIFVRSAKLTAEVIVGKFSELNHGMVHKNLKKIIVENIEANFNQNHQTIPWEIFETISTISTEIFEKKCEKKFPRLSGREYCRRKNSWKICRMIAWKFLKSLKFCTRLHCKEKKEEKWHFVHRFHKNRYF